MATLFTVHDFLWKQWLNLTHSNPGDKNYDIYESIMVFYHVNLGWGIQSSIMALERLDM